MLPSTTPVVTGNEVAAFSPEAIQTLVHKRCPTNVFLSDIGACGQDHFFGTGRIPSDHPLFNHGGRTPRHDILFYTELGRQASLAVTHAFLGVSVGDVFVFDRSAARMTDTIWRLPPAADLVAIEISVREIVRRKNNMITRTVADYRLTIGGELVFSGNGIWTTQTPALFKRLRRMAPDSSTNASSESSAAPIGNRAAECASWGTAVISAAQTQADGALFATLIVDRSHPYFFDHPCDHVPGMLLLEGCTELAAAACGHCNAGLTQPPVVMSYDIDFTRFVECRVPTILTAHVTPGGVAATLDVVISQGDVVAGTARMKLGFPA